MYSQEVTTGTKQVKRIFHGIKRRLHLPKHEQSRGEKRPDFYDQVFLANENLLVHYIASLYYFMSTVIVYRTRIAIMEVAPYLVIGTAHLVLPTYDGPL